MFSAGRQQRYTQLITWAGYWLIAVSTFLAPLVFDTHHLSPVATSKTLLIISVSLVLLGLALAHIFIRNAFAVTLSPLKIALLYFVGVLTLSAVVGFDPLNSFLDGFERSVNVVLMYAAVIFALLFPLFVDTEQKLRIVLLAFFLGAVGLAFSVFLEHANLFTDGLFRYTLGGGTMGNTSLAGGYLLFALFIGSYLLLTSRIMYVKAAYGLGLALMLSAPVLIDLKILHAFLREGGGGWVSIIEAQGAFLGIVIGAGVSLALFLTLQMRKRVRHVGWAFIVLIAVIGAISAWSFLSPDGYLHEKYIEYKTPNRFVFWGIALEGFRERPLLGWGPANYQYIYEQYFNPRVLEVGYKRELWVAYPHNVFLEYVSTTGILGLLGYLALLLCAGYVFYRLRYRTDRHSHILSCVLLGLLVAHATQNFFVFDSPPSILALFLLIGMALYFERGRTWAWQLRVQTSAVSRGVSLPRVLAVGGVAACVAGFVCVVVLPWVASYKLSAIVSETYLPARDVLWDEFMDWPYRGGLTDAGYVADGMYVQTLGAVAGAGDRTARREMLAGEVDNVIAYVEDREAERPVRAYRASYFVLKLLGLRDYLVFDRSEEFTRRVDERVGEVLQISPSNPRGYFAVSQVHANREDFDSAGEYLRIGFELAPRNPGARELITNYLSLHDDPELRALLETHAEAE